MPLPSPLTPAQAANTLAQRLGRVADNIRQIATALGARPYRVFLVWSTWSGSVRGEGLETETQRLELLPTPMVMSMDNIALSPSNIGLIQVGDLKVSEISVSLPEDTLMGRRLVFNGVQTEIPQPAAFCWEIYGDGRQGDSPPRSKFRVRGRPFLEADSAQWRVNLERISDDRMRDGSIQRET